MSIRLAVLSLALAVTASAAHGSTCTAIPVRFTFHETATLMDLSGNVVKDSGGNPVTTPSAVVGDGSGDVYTTNASIRCGTYDAVLNLITGSRKLTLKLPAPLSGTGGSSLTPPPGNYTVNGVVNVRNVTCQGCANPGQPFVTRAGVQMNSMYNGEEYNLRFAGPNISTTLPLAQDFDNDSTWIASAYGTSLVYVAPQPYNCVSSYPSWVVRGTLVNQSNNLQAATLIDMGKNGGGTTNVGQFSIPFEYRIETLSCAVKPY